MAPASLPERVLAAYRFLAADDETPTLISLALLRATIGTHDAPRDDLDMVLRDIADRPNVAFWTNPKPTPDDRDAALVVGSAERHSIIIT